jgi:hypothetical protein
LTDAFSDQPAPPELVLVLDNVRPLPAADLGELFSTMARDYRQLTRGRTLVVTRLETGSLHAYLQDALNQVAPYAKDVLEVVKAAKGIKEFARTLTEIFGRVKEHPSTLSQLKSRRRAGARSIEAIVKIAAESQSEVDLHHETADGGIIDLKVTPIEAIRIREEARAHLASLPPAQTLARLTGNDATSKSLQSTPALFQPSDYADSLVRVRGSSLVEADVHTVVAALADSLTSVGLGSLISMIASNLEGRGHHDLAQMLRGATKSQNRDQEPPITI